MLVDPSGWVLVYPNKSEYSAYRPKEEVGCSQRRGGARRPKEGGSRVLVDPRRTGIRSSWTEGGGVLSQRRPKEEGVGCTWTRRGGSSTEQHGDRDEFPVLEQHPHWQCCVCLLFSGKSRCFYLLFQFYSDDVFIISFVVILVQLYI